MPKQLPILPEHDKNSEQQQLNLSDELNEIFENAAILLMLVNSEGRVVKINRSGMDMTGKNQENILGLLGGEVFDCVNAWRNGRMVCGQGRDCAHCSVRSLINDTYLNGVKHYKVEGKLDVFNQGNRVTLELLISTSLIHAHDEHFVLITIDDITKLKNQERQLNKLLADKDRFMQILAHDLKNPFSLLLGYSELVNNALKDTNNLKLQNHASIMGETLQSTYKLLEDLLLWSKAQAGKIPFTPLTFNPISQINEQMAYLLPQATAKAIQVKLPPYKKLDIIADLNMFHTLVRNLVSNAIKFTRPEGHINIKVNTKNNFAIISIEDSGIGIRENVLIKIWSHEEHYSSIGTNGEKGTGLGLKICKDFAETNGGDIWVESTPGSGSTFSFSVPLAIAK